MAQLVQQTIQDMRGGRDSWRVVLFLSAPAFFISVAAVIVRT